MKLLQLLTTDLGEFSSRLLPAYALRHYQIEAGRLALSAGAGEKAAIVCARQSGKDELLAQLLAFLLFRRMHKGGNAVIGLPTRQQANISRERLLERLNSHPLLRLKTRSSGYIVRVGRASARFLSADPSAGVRGETADLLLVGNEAQDIDPAIWDARFDPMGAACNAPTLFLGTPWSGQTLLAREMREARRQGRLFVADWQRVARDLPGYGQRVQARLEQLGTNHPFIRTEYECRELDETGGLFPANRLALIKGSHARSWPGERAYGPVALLVDVAGSDETSARLDPNKRRDSTALTVVELVVGGARPCYRVLNRYRWENVPLAQQAERLERLAGEWCARRVVVDATGVGAGLVSALYPRLGKRLQPFVFTLRSKSELGWGWLGLIESGRYLEYCDDGAEDTGLFWRQMAAVESEVLPGPGQLMRWSVPDPALHDDLVMSAALVAALSAEDLSPRIALGQ